VHSRMAMLRRIVVHNRTTITTFYSSSQREAKRGQSTNRKGEMLRFALKLIRNLDVTIVKYILSLIGHTVSLFGQTTFRAFGRVSKTTPRRDVGSIYVSVMCFGVIFFLRIFCLLPFPSRTPHLKAVLRVICAESDNKIA
jgi:hypothetical protein